MKVAIVHYWLVGMRGGEKMLEALLEMFPDADIFTHAHDPKSVSALINSRRIFLSRVGRLPFAKKLYQLYMPLMPAALVDFDLQRYDLVISSEAGPAKGVVANPSAFHLCYCHSPMRYAWDMYHEYYRGAGLVARFFMRRHALPLRAWDAASANLVDKFVTNSTHVAKRIRRAYNREAEVVYGPAAVEKYLDAPRAPEDFYLFFGQLAPYKRADLALDACAALGRKIVIAGDGAKKKFVKKYSRSGLARFVGRVSDAEAASLFSRARALLFPGVEDFGLVPVEACAAGCPVIAFREGGALDTVIENVTGIFFDERTPASLASAIERFEQNEGGFCDRDAFRRQATRFSKAAFIARMRAALEKRERV